MSRRLTVVQLLPELEVGGVERGTLEIAEALVAAGHRALVVSAGGRLVDELEACGAEHRQLTIGAKRLTSLVHVPALTRLFSSEGVDIVHARSRLPAWLGRCALRRMPSARRPAWVTTVHGPYSVNAYSRIMTSGDAVIAISAFIRDYIESNYPEVPANRITVIPRGVDTRRYHAGFKPDATWVAAFLRDHPGLVGRTLLTLPGRLTRWKGQEDFLALIAILRRAGRPVHGLVIGGAHPRKAGFADELAARAGQLGIAADVSFLGQRDDLRELLAISTIAYSLTGEPEAFGRTTIEALALGTPVIGYDHGGTGEILTRVYPAGLVAAGDVAAAAARTQALLDSPQAVPHEHPYTIAAMQAATIALYERLCR
ncbi:MAG: glycosyltransferase family 4 protein [Gammaproteobacteria bacterium]